MYVASLFTIDTLQFSRDNAVVIAVEGSETNDVFRLRDIRIVTE